jgi:hypothetical protein
MNLKSLMKFEIFTAEAQRPQRSAKQNERRRIFQTSEAVTAWTEFMEPILYFCVEVRNYKSEKRWINSTGIMEIKQISFGFQAKHNSFSTPLCVLCTSALKKLNPNCGF